jgi:hypothetical protein
MKRTLVLAAGAALVTAIGAVSAHALPQQVYRGQLNGVTGSAVKLRLDPSETGDPDIVRSFTVRYFDVSCRGGALVTMRRAKLIGEIPVGRGGGFSERDDNGETVFKVRGKVGLAGTRAKGTFRYQGAVEVDGGVATNCDSGRLQWKARAGGS